MEYLKYICYFLFITFLACDSPIEKAPNLDTSAFTAQDLKPIIVERSKAWGEACRKKDITPLQDLYDEQAHYLPNDAAAIYGKEAILQYWQESLSFLGDISLQMNSLEGTRELLYETGSVTVQVMDETGAFVPLNYKYVNVWKLQEDGSYQVVIDTFNNLASKD